MKDNIPNLDPFLATNDFSIEQQHLRDKMTTISLYQDLDFFLYSQYENKNSQSMANPFRIEDEKGVLDEERFTYTLSDKEITDLEQGECSNFKIIITKKYNDVHNDLRAFHLKFQGGENDFEMIQLYTHFIYLLQFFYANYKPKQKIIGLPKPARRRFISINKMLVQELIKELEWRVSRLNHLDRFDYDPDDEEMKLRVSAIYKQGINLLNKKKFEENSNEIYKLMVPHFIEQITFKDFCNLFHSEGAIFPHKISWQLPQNSLYYFIKNLQDGGKTSKKNNFRVVEELFVYNGKPIANLTNNKSMSKEATKLDEIIKLF